MMLLSKYDTSKTLSEQGSADINADRVNQQQLKDAPINPLQPKKTTTTQIPKELENGDGVKFFQDWLDENVPNWATGYPNGKLNRGRGYGMFGDITQSAWNNQDLKTKYLEHLSEMV